MTATYLQTQPQSPPPSSSSSRPPSSRRALTRALELAQEAVRIDASNDDPEAAVLAYAKSVALLNEVMEKVMRGEDSDGGRRKPGGRRRSVVAKEDEARRLRSIHDTYADRMHILTLIYNIPPPSIASLSSSTLSYPSSARSSTTAVDSPPDLSQSAFATPEHQLASSQSHHLHADDSYDAGEGIGSAMLTGAPSPDMRSFDDSDYYAAVTPSVSRTSSLHHSSRTTNLPPIRPPPSGPPPTRPQLTDPRIRRSSRAAGAPPQPPPIQPPPMAPPPPPPTHNYVQQFEHPLTLQNNRADLGVYPERLMPHASEDTDSWDGHRELGREEYAQTQAYTLPARRARSGTLDSISGRRRSPPLPPLPIEHFEGDDARSLPARHPFAVAAGGSHNTDDYVPPSSRPVTPASQSMHRPRGNTQSSATSSRSEGESSVFSDRPRTPPPAVPLLVSSSTAQGTISQRRKSNISMPPGSVDSHLSVVPDVPSQPISRSQSPNVEPPSAPPHPRNVVNGPPTNTVGPPGRLRAASQPGRRPSVGQLYGGASDREPPPLPTNPPILPRKTSFTAGFATTRNHVDGTPPPHPSTLPPLNISTPPPTPANKHLTTFHSSPSTHSLPGMPHSTLPPPPPADPQRRPYHLMGLLHNSIASPTGGYLTKRLHVPHDVWTQGGAKLNNIADKAKCVALLEDGLDDLTKASLDFMRSNPATNSNGVVLSGPGIAMAIANKWIRALDDWLSVCENVAATFGKKFDLNDGATAKKTAVWSNKVTRAVDRMTNGKNLDSPTQYVQNLSQLFSMAQLFDDHHKVLSPQHPPTTTYSAISPDSRSQVELKLKRASEFFSSFVLVFVIRDLGQLLDKYAKKGERWMEE